MASYRCAPQDCSTKPTTDTSIGHTQNECGDKNGRANIVMHPKQMRTAGAWVLGGVMATAFVLIVAASATAGEAAEELREAEAALEKMADRDRTGEEATEAEGLGKRVHELRRRSAPTRTSCTPSSRKSTRAFRSSRRRSCHRTARQTDGKRLPI